MGEVVAEQAARGVAIHSARGPRAVEAYLLERSAELLAQARREPERLALPIRIVVPSRSLADHVGERIVAQARRGVAGLLVQTLHGLALEVLERTGAALPAADALFPILVRRLAADEPVLREPLGELVDGYATVEAAVADLLDAGFDADSAEAALDALAAVAGDAATLARALAVARVARRCLAEMHSSGVGHRALLLCAAREALLLDADAALPARAILVHGFADATGLRAELIEALVRYRHAKVLIDEPPDPADPGVADAGRRFTERLRVRLLGVAAERVSEAASAPASEIAWVEAVSPDAEVREVATRVRRALDDGTPPERIGVVARELSGYRAALRLHFRRLGIPFSGASPGGMGPLARRAGALDVLLRERGSCGADRWLDAAALPAEAGAASELRLELRRQGLLRLCDVAAHTPEGERLRRAVAAARATCAWLSRMADAGTCRVQLAAFEDLLLQGLGWQPGSAEIALLRNELEGLRATLPPEFPLTMAELALLLRRRFARVIAEPLGGHGGGVQILDAMQARARTFDVLFLIGLVRDVFPRSVREESLLPDFVRESLRDALPDVPLKKLGHDEERFLFAQLVAASPRVTLCWPIAMDDGRPCARSSFVERLRWGAAGFQPVRVFSILTPSATLTPDTGAPMRCLREHALIAALHASRQQLAKVLPLALRELGLAAACADPEAHAQARLRVLAELEPGPGGAAAPRLGPYYGFVGAARGPADPRARPLYVTQLEGMARCAWQTFVQRLLAIGPRPDSKDALPGSDARLRGMTVHGVLAALLPEGCDPVTGNALCWPEPAGLEALARAQAARVLAQEHVLLPGLARVLALQALPFLERARELDALDGDRLRVTGAEQLRTAAIADAHGGSRELRFRVDRIERIDGAERLTDFKTGAPLSSAKGAAKRAEHLLAAVARGGALQPVAYALAAEPGGAGRLLYLDPELEGGAEAASFVARREDASLGAAFDGATRALLGAWDAGSFLPRLVKPDSDEEPSVCESCEVAQACLQGDTGSRQRLAAWLAEPRSEAGAGLGAAERALLAVFQLGARPAKRVETDAESE